VHSSLEQGMKISLGDRFFVDKRIISAVKKVEFVGSRISYIILRDHILKHRRRLSSILDVRYFRGADCDSDHYLTVAKVTERLAVSKRMVKKMDVERFNLKQLNEKEAKEHYQVTIIISL
jgi:hypothetical protein